MNYLDYTIIILVSIFTIKGLFKGFIHEVFGLVGLIASLVLATKLMGGVSDWIAGIADIPPTLNAVLGFIIVFFLVMLISQLVIHMAQKVVKWALLGWADKLAGALSGFLKGAIIASLMLLIMTAMPLVESLLPGKDDSKLFKPTKKFAPAVFDLLVAAFPHSKSFYEEVKDSISGFSAGDLGEHAQSFLESLSDNNDSTQKED